MAIWSIQLKCQIMCQKRKTPHNSFLPSNVFVLETILIKTRDAKKKKRIPARRDDDVLSRSRLPTPGEYSRGRTRLFGRRGRRRWATLSTLLRASSSPSFFGGDATSSKLFQCVDIGTTYNIGRERENNAVFGRDSGTTTRAWTVPSARRHRDEQ